MPIYIGDLLILYNIKIAIIVFNKCLHLEILEIKNIIIIEVVIVKKYEFEIMKKKFYILN